MSLLEILRGEKPFFKHTNHNRLVSAIEREFPSFLNNRSAIAPGLKHSKRENELAAAALRGEGLGSNAGFRPGINYDEFSGYGTGVENSNNDINLQIIPGDATFVQFSNSGPTGAGQVAIIYQVPTQFNFLLTGAYMVADNGGPPGIGSGMDWVPVNLPQDKQTIGGVGDTAHIEGNYILVPNQDNAGWGGNQVSLARNIPQLIPAGATIRCVRTADSVANTMFGKVWGYLLPQGRAQKDKNPPPNYKAPPKTQLGPQLFVY